MKKIKKQSMTLLFLAFISTPFSSNAEDVTPFNVWFDEREKGIHSISYKEISKESKKSQLLIAECISEKRFGEPNLYSIKDNQGSARVTLVYLKKNKFNEVYREYFDCYWKGQNYEFVK